MGGVLLLNLYLLDTGTLGCVELVVNPLVSRHHRTITGVGGSGKVDRQRLAMTRRGLNKFAFVMITDPTNMISGQNQESIFSSNSM